MNAITIPKDLAAGDDLVLLPRKEYERLVAQAPAPRGAKLTKAQRADLARARKARAGGTLLSYDAFIRALAAPRWSGCRESGEAIPCERPQTHRVGGYGNAFQSVRGRCLKA